MGQSSIITMHHLTNVKIALKFEINFIRLNNHADQISYFPIIVDSNLTVAIGTKIPL